MPPRPPLPPTRSSTTVASSTLKAGPTRPVASLQPGNVLRLPLDFQIALLADEVNRLRQRLGLVEQQLAQTDDLLRTLRALVSATSDSMRRTDLIRQRPDGVLELPNDTRLRMQVGNVALTLDGTSVTIDGAQTIRVQGGAVQVQGSSIELSASTVKLTAALVKADGVVQCDTVVANTVVGSSYTPGAGNIW